MSKLVSDLVDEFQSIVEITDDFELFLTSIKFDDSDEVTTESTEAISHIEIDNENQECLFLNTSKGKALTVGRTNQVISSINSDFYLCSAKVDTLNDSSEKLNNPVIGFGENIELKQFFIVCESH